ncbi:unnamed protein product [Trichobilharzia szidati]|nr:unnamed protein product [Trichobilharzia szidati]
MLLGIVSAYQVWICICIIFEVSAEWELSCYNESLHIQCGAEKSIVIHEAHFGYFRDILLVSNSTKKCRSPNAKDCWIDVTADISRRCSGHSLCKSSVHYSSELSAELLSRECSFISDNLAEPTLFVEYECISTTLITRISNENHVDPDQIGGYLISLDYNEIIQSGSEWRSHLADAMCGAPTVNNHLPHRFYLPAPKLSTTRQSSIHHHHNDNDNNNADDSSLFNKGILATFILRIKDIGLTKSSNVNMMPSASSSSTSSRTSISNNNNNHNNDLILATGPACPSDPGKACHHDYLSIDARVSSSYNSTEIIIPIVRFCLVNSSAKTSASSSQSAAPTHASASSASSASSPSSMSFPSFSFSSSTITYDNDYQKLFPADETHLVGQVYGPISNAFGLQFTSNLNLLDPYIIHGKGIMIEYIALLCVPINPPSGNGIVDYRFRTNPHTSHTFAYAEIFCPSDRWLEPTDPGLDEVYSGIIHTPTTNNKNHSDNNAWWLERRRHVTLICDHHERKWTPNRLPEACLTSDELTTFVAQITKKLQESKSSMPNGFASDNNTLNGANITAISSSSSSLKAVDNGDEEDAAARNGYTYQATHISSVVLGSILGVLVLVLAVLLVVYSLRHKLFDQYHKTVNLAAISSSSRLGSSSLTTFSRSKDTLLFPTFKKSSYNTLVTNGNHRNLFKSYPHLISHQTIMNESVPDLPTRPQQLQLQQQQSSVPLAASAATTRTTALHSSMITGMNKKTSNIDLMRGNGGYLPPWRSSLKNNHNNIINSPVTPNAISALTLVPNTPGSEHRQMMTSLPWLRTNSSTHITTTNHHNNKSMTNQNGSSNNNNNNSAFGASSETMLFSSLNIPNGLPRSWWLPWRKSMRKKRRLYTQLQRRQEIQSSLSQRGLLESSNMLDNKSTPHLRNSGYLMTSSNGFLISEPSRSGGPMPPLPPIPQSATSSKREEVSHSFAAKHPPLPQQQQQQLRIKPDGGTGSERVKTTLLTNDGNNFGGVCSTLYTNQDPMNSPTSLMLYTNYQSKMTPDEQSMLNTSTIYPNKANSNNIQSFPSSSSTASSWMNMVNNNGADNDLPWKFTPPNRNSFSNGIRRLSSFFRSFHQSNGSFTPPRNFSASFKKSSYRSSSFNSRSEMPSMPTLPTFNHRTTSNMSNNNHNNNNDINNSSNNYINHAEQPMANHDSFRLLSGRHITHPLMQSSTQALSESSDLHKKHTRAYNLWANQTVKPSLFQQDGYNSFNVYGSSGDEHTTIGDMLSGSRNTTKTSLQGSSRLDSLLSTELIDLCGAATTTAAGSGGALNKDDPFVKGNTTSTTLKDPNSIMYTNNNNRFDYIEKDQINQSPYITTTDPYLEPVSLKRRQQNLITNQINNIDNNNNNNNNRTQTNGKINGDTGINTNYDLLKGNKPDQHAIHSGTSSAISSLVFADDCDIISKVSDNSLNKSDQYSELHRLTPQISNKSIVSNPTPVAPAPPPLTAAHKTANPPTNILNIPQLQHDIPTIDYVTYDEARSTENNLLIQNKKPVKQSIKSPPPSVDYKSNNNNNNNNDDDDYYAQNILKSNETILSSRSSIMPDYSQMKRRRSTIKSCDSRPLSDAMISNHYYDLNKNTNYQDISMISPSQPPGDGGDNIPSAIKSHPPLPPLWSNNNDRNFGSVDSLYETVDLPKTNSAIPTMAPKTATAMAHMIQRPSLMPSSMNTNYAERCKMALPPTPSSFSIKAPVRSIGEMDDWNLPGSDDSDDDDNLGS